MLLIKTPMVKGTEVEPGEGQRSCDVRATGQGAACMCHRPRLRVCIRACVVQVGFALVAALQSDKAPNG